MMNITVLCVGKLKESFYLAAVKEYEKRLSALCRLRIIELPEERLPEAPSPAQIQQALAKERDAVLARLPKNAAVAALCIEGEALSSEALAKRFDSWASGGTSHIVFLIGSSYGMDPALKARAGLRLSLSPMTFPHHLARVMLLEQIYRAFQINGGGKYHK